MLEWEVRAAGLGFDVQEAQEGEGVWRKLMPR